MVGCISLVFSVPKPWLLVTKNFVVWINVSSKYIGYGHQQHACHFKMAFWLVDKPQSLVDKVNMAKIPVNKTPPCIQGETLPIQDTVLSTGYIVLLTGQLPC